MKEGLINLDFADVKSVMRDMGRAMMGTGEAAGEGRAKMAAEAAIANPLLDEASMMGAKGVLVSISGGMDMTLFEVDEAATRIREEVDGRRRHHRRGHFRPGTGREHSGCRSSRRDYGRRWKCSRPRNCEAAWHERRPSVLKLAKSQSG